MPTTQQQPRTTSFNVRRTRHGDGAPSLSLRYTAESHGDALAAHFRAYPAGVAKDTSYSVVHTASRTTKHYNADRARQVYREAMRRR